ncbi:MAG TPA: hypothetical protein VF240_21520 [Pyrinomonadaceae bacterium]
MKRRGLSGLLCALCCVAGLTFSATPAKAQGSRYVGRDIVGTVVGVGGRLGGRTRQFRLIVERYTSPQDVQRLTSALQTGGQDELLSVLSKLNAGRIQIGTGVGITANAIIPTELPEGGTKLVVLFQRNINFYELRHGTRSEDYKFGYAELHLGRKGDNEGTFIAAAKIKLEDGNSWVVEDFGEFPARLLGLQARGGKGGAR